jgi:hypothetical protein
MQSASDTPSSHSRRGGEAEQLHRIELVAQTLRERGVPECKGFR